MTFDSKKYWINRYETHKNSGSGSYNRLCDFKNKIVNDFVLTYNVQNVTELGSGDGNQLLNSLYPEYHGYDVSSYIIDKCSEQFKDRPEYKFYHLDDDIEIKKSELALSMDVLFHLIEDEVYETYIEKLFNASSKYVIIYSPDQIHEEFLKKFNVNRKTIGYHVKLRKFTDDVSRLYPDWILSEVIINEFPYKRYNPNTSFCNFYIYHKSNL